MPWADMNPAEFWLIAGPLMGLAFVVLTWLGERTGR